MSDQQKDKKNQEYHTEGRKITKLQVGDERFLNEDERNKINTIIQRLIQKQKAQQFQHLEPSITSLQKKDQIGDKEIKQRQDEPGLKLESSNPMLANIEQEIFSQIQQNKPDSRIESIKKQEKKKQQLQNCWFLTPMLQNPPQNFFCLNYKQQIFMQFKFKKFCIKTIFIRNLKKSQQSQTKLQNQISQLQNLILKQQNLHSQLQLQLDKLSQQLQQFKPEQQQMSIQQILNKYQDKVEFLKIIKEKDQKNKKLDQKNKKLIEIFKLKGELQKSKGELQKLKGELQKLKIQQSILRERKKTNLQGLQNMKQKLLYFGKLFYSSQLYHRRSKLEPFKDIIKLLQKTCLRKTSYQEFQKQFKFESLMNPTKVRFQELINNLNDKQIVGPNFYLEYQKEILDLVQGGFLIKMDEKYFNLMSILIREGFTERFKESFQQKNSVKRPLYQARHFCQCMIRESQIIKNSVYLKAAETVISQTRNSQIIRELMKDYLNIYKKEQQKKQTVQITTENIKLFLNDVSYYFFDYGFPKMQGITTNNSLGSLAIFFNTFVFQNNKYNEEFFKGYIFYVFLHESMHYLVRKFGLVVEGDKKSISKCWSKKKLHPKSKQSKYSLNKEGGQMFQIYLFGKKVQKVFQSDYQNNEKVMTKFSHQNLTEQQILDARKQFFQIQNKDKTEKKKKKLKQCRYAQKSRR